MEKLNPHDSSTVIGLICQALKKQSNADIIKFLIEKTEVPLNTKTSDGETVLLAAIKHNCSLKTIKYLIKNGADPNMKNEKNESPWTLAVEKADDRIIKCFSDNFENSSCSKNLVDTVKEYFDETKIFDVNQETNEKTRLNYAIADKDNILCHFLLRKGANVHLSDANGNSSLYLAWKNKMFDVVRLLLFYGATFNENDNDEKFLADKQIQKYTNIKKQTLWHIKAECKNNALEQKGIQTNQVITDFICKSTINQKDVNGNTALHLAAQNDDYKFIIELLENGAFYDIENNKAEVPYDLIKNNPTAAELFENIEEEFCDAENNIFNPIINARNKMGKTLSHYAVFHNNIKEIYNLAEEDLAVITAEDQEKRTPLYYAVKNKSHEIVKCLLNSAIFLADSAKTYKDIPESESTILISRIQKCMDHVFNEEIDEIIGVLEPIKCNEEFDIVVNIGQFEKRVACLAARNYKLAKYLLQEGVIFDPLENSKIEKAMTLLNKFAENVISKEFYPESIINYYKNYVKPSLCNMGDYRHLNYPNGGTLLHLAAAVNEKEIVEWLIKEKNADPDVKDHDGNNVYDVAKANNSGEVLSILSPKSQNN
uniref:Ankyrin repeat protein n=1 Tax=Panagrolaimus sp. ES5 TaxID=591445 RepID=A0AC34FWB2_9BILA